jgi:hypothetical protein
MEKMKLILAATLIASMSSLAAADILTLKPGPNAINGVNISTGATASIDANKTTIDLTTINAGLRAKQVIFSIPVYVAQLLLSDPSRYVHTANGALPSIDNEQTVAMRLTFLRDVDAQTIATSFQDGLDANKISAKDPDIAGFMKAVTQGGDVKNASSVTILITKNADGSETLAYENGVNAAPTIVKGSKDFMHKVMSLWLGNTADSGLADLKKELVK